MKKLKSTILFTTILLFIIALILGLYLLINKFDDINILSIQNEYNLVINSDEDRMNVPIYFSNKKSFLTSKKTVEKVELVNDLNSMLVTLNSIEYIDTIKYNDEKYYEFDFSLSFNNYDEFTEPLFISGCNLKVTYTNDKVMEYAIGNLNIYINKKEVQSNPITIRKLYATTNIISDTETIVGMNFSFYNSSDKVVIINKILDKNKYYELDYMNHSSSLIGSKEDLTTIFDNYSYICKTIETGSMNITLNPKEEVTIFIPLKYLNGIKYVDRLAFYIEYMEDSINKEMIIDDFQFMKKKYIVFDNGLSKYVYRYK